MLAGFWPPCPHPTLFPGGQGSVAPSYEIPSGTFTFYYLELALEAKLQRKVTNTVHSNNFTYMICSI